MYVMSKTIPKYHDKDLKVELIKNTHFVKGKHTVSINNSYSTAMQYH